MADESLEQQKRNWTQVLGPGLITGASDDDPSGIATYSQIGAQFGYGLLWTLPYTYPLMVAIQLVAAQIGRVTGRGIAGNMRHHYPRWLMFSVVTLMTVANTINIGADIGAMGSAVKLLFQGSALVYSAAFTALSIVLMIFVPYHTYVRVLKWLCVVLFAYIAVAFIVHIDIKAAMTGSLIPRMSWKAATVTSLVAVLGTTISPYLFFWQASEEVEDLDLDPEAKPLRRRPKQAHHQLERIRSDTFVGMFFSNIVAWFVVLAVAATLNKQGITDISTSEQAANALRPVAVKLAGPAAGQIAFLLFALGIVGTGLLAIPVLAGSAAYGIGEALHWPTGLERKPKQAKGFYAVIAVASVVGLGLNLIGVNPIKALFWSAVINGVAAGPIMIVMMLMCSSRNIMGDFTAGRTLRFFGWLSTAVMIAAAILMFAFWGK